MRKPPSLSYGSTAILHAVASGSKFGFDIMASTGLTSGTVYPALDRLEHAGYLRSKWEDETAAHAEGRPARRYYRLTAEGTQVALDAVEETRRTVRGLGRPQPGWGQA